MVITRISIKPQEDGVLIFDVSGALITETGHKISEVSFSNESWYSKERKIDVPVEVYTEALKMFTAFLPIMSEKVNGIFKELPAPATTPTATEGVVVEGLDDLPF